METPNMEAPKKKVRMVVNLAVLSRMSADTFDDMLWLTRFGPSKVLDFGYSGMGQLYVVHEHGVHYVGPNDIFEVNA